MCWLIHFSNTPTIFGTTFQKLSLSLCLSLLFGRNRKIRSSTQAINHSFIHRICFITESNLIESHVIYLIISLIASFIWHTFLLFNIMMFFSWLILGREDKTQFMDCNFSYDQMEIINVISYICCFYVVLCYIVLLTLFVITTSL